MSVSPNKLAADVYSIQLAEGEDLISEHDCLELGGLMQLPNLFKSQMISSVAHLDCITLLVGDPATPDPPDVEAANETPVNAKSECLATVRKVLQRQVSGHLGGKFTQHLVEYFLELLRISPRDKSAGHDASSINRWRKYKRSASFDSRKVGLFFSILSIIGTLVLIYLTLRVRWISEASVPA